MNATATNRLDKFFQQILAANPFTNEIIKGPSRTDVDVPEIHDAPFKKLVTLARSAHATNQGTGVMLWGERGIGKSHLLSRLWRWADDNEQACFIWLHNLQSDAERLPRYVLKCVISSLTQERTRAFHDTPLYRLVKAALREALRLDGGGNIRSPDRLESAYDKLIDRMMMENPSRATLLDRTICQVLFRFYLSANIAHYNHQDDGVALLAASWLGGDFIDREEAGRLGLRLQRDTADTVTLADDQHIKQVLFALTQLALYRHQPFLLCFDQVDNLDESKLAGLARFLHALLDASGNLLVIFSGVQSTLLRFRERGIITDASWDRLAGEKILLSAINIQDSRRILEARLTRFHEPFQDIPEVADQRSRDSLFPLGTAWFDDRLGEKNDFRPRAIISWAKERWAQQQDALAAQGGAAWLKNWPGKKPPPPSPPPPPPEELIDRRVDEKMAEHKALVKDRPHTLPPSADNLAGLVRTLLEQCLGHDSALVRIDKPRPPRPNQKPACDFVVRLRPAEAGQETTTGLTFLATGNATSTTGALRKLDQEKQTLDRILLVTEERLPLKLGAQKDSQGRKYLESLKGLGPKRFHHIELSFDQYADLDALQAAIGLARSGDLEVELPGGQSRPVSEQEVITSHHRQCRYTARPLLRQVLQPSSEPDVPDPGASSEGASSLKTVREFIMAQLALTMGASSHELALRLPGHLKATERRTPEDCEVLVRQAAQQLHGEGRLNAAPLGEGNLFLLPKTR